MEKIKKWTSSRIYKTPKDIKDSKEIDNCFVGFTSIINVIMRILGFKNKSARSFDINYLPIFYVKTLRDAIIEMYKQTEDPIESGDINISNLDFTLEYVKDIYESEKTKEEAIIKKAGYLLFNIVLKHPFVDGNKRTGLVVCNSFLEINRYTISKIPYKKTYDLIIAIAEGKKEEIDCQNFIKENIRQDKKTEFNIKKILKYFKELEKTIK